MKIRFITFLSLMLYVGVFFSCDDSTIPEVKSIYVDQDSVSLEVGETAQLEAYVLPIDADIYNSINFSTSDANVATVSEDGLITARYSGTCQIVLFSDNVYSYVSVTVLPLKVVLTSLTKGVCIEEASSDETADDTRSTYVIKLLEPTLDLSTFEYTVSGVGTMLNLVTSFASDAEYIPDGMYTFTTEPEDGGFQIGTIETVNGKFYAQGSYVAYYTNNGTSVILIKSGVVNIQRAGDIYKVALTAEGANQEIITMVYHAEIELKQEVVRSTVAMQYTTMTDVVTDTLSTSLIHELTFTNATLDSLMTISVVTPSFSEAYIPLGSYTFSEEIAPFNVLGSRTYATIKTETPEVKVAFLDGSFVSSSQNKAYYYEARFLSEDHIYVLQSVDEAFEVDDLAGVSRLELSSGEY